MSTKQRGRIKICLETYKEELYLHTFIAAVPCTAIVRLIDSYRLVLSNSSTTERQII